MIVSAAFTQTRDNGCKVASNNPVLLLAFMTASGLSGQTAALSGRVSDQSGAVIPGAKVTLNGPQRLVRTATSGGDGSYAFKGLTPGDYSVIALAPQLVMPAAIRVTLNVPGETVNLQLRVAATAAQVTVQENAGPAVCTEASSNASATIVTGARSAVAFRRSGRLAGRSRSACRAHRQGRAATRFSSTDSAAANFHPRNRFAR